MTGKNHIIETNGSVLPRQKFTTLEEWTRFMKDKKIVIIRETHPNYKQHCRFIEMIGANNLIKHPDNQNGNKIRMKVKTIYGQVLNLKPGDFFVEETSVIYNYPKTGLNNH